MFTPVSVVNYVMYMSVIVSCIVYFSTFVTLFKLPQLKENSHEFSSEKKEM